MDLETAKKLEELNRRQNIYLWSNKITYNNKDTPIRLKVTSVKTWKTRPETVLIGLKYGLYEYLKISETELEDYETDEAEAQAKIFVKRFVEADSDEEKAKIQSKIEKWISGTDSETKAKFLSVIEAEKQRAHTQ